jgi:NADH-quinone oxidoreductase subunit E
MWIDEVSSLSKKTSEVVRAGLAQDFRSLGTDEEMLTEGEREEIRAQLGQYDHKRAGCVEALKMVQARHGWVSDGHLREVAELLDMTAEELDAVATFYSLIFRRPVGRHVILICDSITCWIMGYEDLLAHLSGRLGIGLGETSQDGRFTLLPIPCLGCCDHAPAMMIDDTLYGDLSREKIDEILERYGEA